MKKKFSPFVQVLKKKQEQQQYQQLRAILPLDHQAQKNQILLNTNDPLMLSSHPFVKERTLDYLLRWGTGSTPTRILPAHLVRQEELETKLASLLGTQSAILLPSSFSLEEEILQLSAQRNATILIDRLAKNGLYQAAYRTKAQVLRFEHNDLLSLQKELKRAERSATKIIIVESLSPYEGDFAPLKEIEALAEKNDCLLLVDESDALSAYGNLGMGLCAKRINADLITGSFPKTCGRFGCYLGCSKVLKEFFLTFPEFQAARWVPPAILGVIDAYLDLIPDMEMEREQLKVKSSQIRYKISEIYDNLGKGQSHIIPIISQHEKESLELFERLGEKEVFAKVIKPPAVPFGKSRVNLHISKDLKDEQLETLMQVLKHPKRSLLMTR